MPPFAGLKRALGFTPTPAAAPPPLDFPAYYAALQAHAPWFRQLANVVGGGGARRTAEMVFLTDANPATRTINLAAFAIPLNGDLTAQAWAELQDSLYCSEVGRIQARKTYLAMLSAEVQGGTLRSRLTGATEPTANYYTPAPGAAAPTGRTLAFEQAVAWVTKGWSGPDAAKVRAMLKATCVDHKLTPPIGHDSASLTRIWRLLVPNPPKSFRGPTRDAAKYPSSIGGQFLLRWTFQHINHTAYPADGDPKWVDLALFMFAAVMTVQAFPDGNKRAARTAYAMVLLRGGVPFVAPTNALGATLADMQ